MDGSPQTSGGRPRPGQAAGALARRAASLPSFDRAIDELIARAHQVEPEADGEGDRRKLDDVRQPAPPAPAPPSRPTSPPWLAIGGAFVVGVAAMFGASRLLGRDAPSRPVAAVVPAPAAAPAPPSTLAVTSCTTAPAAPAASTASVASAPSPRPDAVMSPAPARRLHPTIARPSPPAGELVDPFSAPQPPVARPADAPKPGQIVDPFAAQP